MKDIEDEVKSLKNAVKVSKEDTDKNEKALVKKAVVNVFKSIKKFGVASEEQFKEIFDAEIKATFQNTETATDGAEFVFDEFSKDVYAIFEKFELAKELSEIKITGKSITLPRYDGGTECYYVDEGGDYTSSKASTSNLKIDVYKLGALVTFTDEMLSDDMTTDTLYSLIIDEIGVKYAGKIEDEVLNWTTKILGILPYAGINSKTSTSTTFGGITENDLLDSDALINDKYDINPNNKVAVMLKATFNKLRQKRDANGILVYPELRDANPTILNHRVIKSSKMPAEASWETAILLGNIKDFYYFISIGGFSSEMGYLSWDFKAGKKTLRIDQRKGWVPKDIKAFCKLVIS